MKIVTAQLYGSIFDRSDMILGCWRNLVFCPSIITNSPTSVGSLQVDFPRTSYVSRGPVSRWAGRRHTETKKKRKMMTTEKKMQTTTSLTFSRNS